MNFENTMLNEISKSQKNRHHMNQFHELSKIVKFRESKDRTLVSRG